MSMIGSAAASTRGAQAAAAKSMRREIWFDGIDSDHITRAAHPRRAPRCTLSTETSAMLSVRRQARLRIGLALSATALLAFAFWSHRTAAAPVQAAPVRDPNLLWTIGPADRPKQVGIPHGSGLNRGGRADNSGD